KPVQMQKNTRLAPAAPLRQSVLSPEKHGAYNASASVLISTTPESTATASQQASSHTPQTIKSTAQSVQGHPPGRFVDSPCLPSTMDFMRLQASVTDCRVPHLATVGH